MPELYIDPAAAFKSGYEATTKVGEDVAASATLRQAYDQAPTDPESATGDQKDMFKVNTIAAQMAARAGRTRVAEQFQKQAEVSKTNALQQQLDTIKVEEAKFDQFERTLESITTGEEGVAEVLKSKLPEDQKMNLVSKFKAVGDDPAKLQTLKDRMRKQAMSAKDNVLAERQLAEYELKVEKVRLDEVYRATKLRIDAGKGIGKLSPEDKELQTELHEDVRGIRADAKSEIDATNKNYGLNDAQKAAKIVGIKKRRDDAIKAARDEFKHRDDEESPEPVKAKPTKEFNLTPAIKAQVEKIDIKNLLKVADDPKERESFDQHYGQPGLADALIKDSKTEAPAPKKEVESPLPKKPGYKRVKGNRGWKYEKLVGRQAAANKEGL